MTFRNAMACLSAGLLATVSAQPTLTPANVPSPGSEFPVWSRDGYASHGPAGANVDYDYWNMLLPNTGNRSYRWHSASVSPTSSSIPSATLLSTDGGSDTLFWAVTANGLEQVGSKATDEGGNPVSYTDAILELKLPCTFGTTWTDATSASINTMFGTVARTGSIQGHADGYGTLRMPFMQVIPNVLRVKVRRDLSDQSALGLVRRIRNSRYFYAAASTYPLLKLQEDSIQVFGGGWAVTYRAEWQGNGFTVGLDEHQEMGAAFTAYPNPARDQVTVLLGEPAQAEARLFDATGRVVRRMRFAANLAMIDVSGLAPGTYALQVLDGAGRNLGMQRLAVE